MKIGFMFVGVVLGAGLSVNAAANIMNRSISAEAVANYELQAEPVQAVNEIKLATVIARYEQTPGALLTIANPFEHAQVEYLAMDGQSVAAGDTVARISGPAVEHFFHRLEIVTEQFAVATQQYTNKKKLYQANALSADEWQQFLSAYIELSDAMHELNIQTALFSQTAEDVATLQVPSAGKWLAATEAMAVGQLLPQTRLAFAAEVPASVASDVQALEIQGQRMEVIRYSESSRNGLVKVWASANDQTWMLGEAYAAQPIIAAEQAYRVPVAAVTSLHDKSIVFVADAARIHPVEVEIQSLADGHYYVTAQQALTAQVVTASVPALQALLIEQESDE